MAKDDLANGWRQWKALAVKADPTRAKAREERMRELQEAFDRIGRGLGTPEADWSPDDREAWDELDNHRP